jgi:hypothetical protein
MSRKSEKCPGAGSFAFHKELVLTKEGLQFSRSKWNLPEIFRGVKISYYSEKSWKSDYFQSAGRGQEFVVTCTAEIEEWTKSLRKTRHSRRLGYPRAFWNTPRARENIQH